MMEKLLNDIGAFLQKAPISATTFGRLSVNDGKLIARLQNGGEVLPSTEKRIRKFIKAYSKTIQ